MADDVGVKNLFKFVLNFFIVANDLDLFFLGHGLAAHVALRNSKIG